MADEDKMRSADDGLDSESKFIAQHRPPDFEIDRWPLCSEPLPGDVDEEKHGKSSSRGTRRIKAIRTFCLDVDLVIDYGFRGAVIAKNFECWTAGKLRRSPDEAAETYDTLQVLAARLGMKSSTLHRYVRTKLKSLLVVRKNKNRKNVLTYSFKNQASYFKTRQRVRRVWCRKSEAEEYGFPAAIILYNLRYWKGQNQERWRLYDGRFWQRASLGQLALVYDGFLSYHQIQKAVKLLERKGMIRRIDYYDSAGIYREDQFWITLTEGSDVADFESRNYVRWEGLRLRDGTIVSPSQKWKTPSPKWETASQNWKTYPPEFTAQAAHPEGNKANPATPLKEASFTSSAVAIAPSEFVTDSLKGNLPQPPRNRPSASQPPAAASSGAATEPPGALTSSFGVADNEHDRKVSVLQRTSIQKQSTRSAKEGIQVTEADPGERIRKPDQQPSKNESHSREVREDAQGIGKHNGKPSQALRVNAPPPVLSWRFPKCVQEIVQQEIELGVQGMASAKDARQKFNSQYEIIQARDGKMKLCHGNEYNSQNMACQDCIWKRSCIEMLPANLRKAGGKPREAKTDFEKELRAEKPDQVRHIYQDTYQQVFGSPAPDALGPADEVLSSARQLNMSARLFCLVFMNVWARSHPKQQFHSRFLVGEAAFNHVSQVCSAARSEYASASERSLALLFGKYHKGNVNWRHQPTPVEEFLDSCEQAWEARFRVGYEVSREDIDEVLMFLEGEKRKSELERLVPMIEQALAEGRPAKDWFSYRTKPRCLAQVVRWLRDAPESEADLEWHRAEGERAVNAGLAENWSHPGRIQEQVS